MPAKTISWQLVTLLSIAALISAPYRLNRSADSALALYLDNTVSAVGDQAGDLHLVYTDSTANSRWWQVYYRSFKDGYWSIPVRLSSDTADNLDNRSPQIVFDPGASSLYVAWLGLSASSTARTYRLFIEKVDPANGDHSPVKAFDYGMTSFQPRIATAPGKVFFLSEERPARNRTVFRARVFVTASGEWTERRLENSQTEGVSYPAIAASVDQSVLFWVRTTSQGYDIMASRMLANNTAWSEARSIFRSPAPPEALSADARGKLLSLVWTVRGGGRNSILMQTSSQDGGANWRDPDVLYSAGVNAAGTVTVVSDRDVVALLSVPTDQGDRIQMKYSTDGGQSWLPTREIDALDIAPGRDATKAQRPTLTFLSPKTLILAWEEWQADGPTLAFKFGPLHTLATSTRHSILGIKERPKDRFQYFPQLWTAGKKAYVTYGSKRRPQSAMARISSNDLYVAALPSVAAPRPQPVRKQAK